MNAPHEHIHQLGNNPAANRRVMRLWRAARKILGKRAGYVVSPVKLEPTNGLLAMFGAKQSVFSVVAQHPQVWAGHLEVRVSQLTGLVTVAPMVMAHPVVYPRTLVRPVRLKAMPKQFRRFARDVEGLVPA